MYVNDSDAAYSETKDIFVKLNNLSGLGDVGSLVAGDYFAASMGNNSGSGNNQSNTGGSTSDYANPLITAPEPKITKVKMASATDSGANPKTGILKAGDIVTATVAFSESVTVTGSNPTLDLTIGNTTRTATYASGSGTNTLSFSYQIVTGDNDINGISFPANGLQTTGTIKDADGNNALLNFNARVDNYKFKVDTLAPTATEQFPIVYSTNGNGGFLLRLSDDIDSNALTINDFSVVGKTLGDSASISINNQPYGLYESTVTINLGSGATVAKDDVLSIGAGKVVDLAGNSNIAPLTFTVPEMTVPVIAREIGISRDYSQIQLGVPKLGVGYTLKFDVYFSENVTVTGTPTITINVGGQPETATFDSSSYGGLLTFVYTTKEGDNDSDGVSVDAGSISLNGGSIKDDDNNDAILNYPAVASASWAKIDTTAPTAALTNPIAVMDMNADDTLNAGDTIQISFAEVINAYNPQHSNTRLDISDFTVSNNHSLGNVDETNFQIINDGTYANYAIKLGANATIGVGDTLTIPAGSFYDEGGNANAEIVFTVPANASKAYTVASFNNGTGLSANDYVYLYDTKANIQAALPDLITHIDLLDVVKQSDDWQANNSKIVMTKAEYKTQGVAAVFDSARVTILAQNYDDLSDLSNLNRDDMIDIPNGANVRLTGYQTNFAWARDANDSLVNGMGDLTGAGIVTIDASVYSNLSSVRGLGADDSVEMGISDASNVRRLTAEQHANLNIDVLADGLYVEISPASTNIVANPEINNYILAGMGANTITLTSPTQRVVTANHNSEQIVKTGDLVSWSGNFQGNSTATDILEVQKSMSISSIYSIDKIRLADGVELTMPSYFDSLPREISGVDGQGENLIISYWHSDFTGITLTNIDTIKIGSDGGVIGVAGANHIELSGTPAHYAVSYKNVNEFGDTIDATNVTNCRIAILNTLATEQNAMRYLQSAGAAGTADSAQGVATFVNENSTNFVGSSDLTTGSSAFFAVADTDSWAVYRYVAAEAHADTVDASELTLVAQVIGNTTIQAFIVNQV